MLVRVRAIVAEPKITVVAHPRRYPVAHLALRLPCRLPLSLPLGAGGVDVQVY